MPSSLENVYIPGSFALPNLSAKESSTPTGMKDEYLLLSWFIVLLRMKEDRQANCGWIYQTREPEIESELARGELSTNKVLGNLKSTVGQATVAISKYMTGAVLQSLEGYSTPVSLLLSTEYRLNENNKAKDDSTLYLETYYMNGHLRILPARTSENVSQYVITQYAEALSHTIRMCISNHDAVIEDFLHPFPHDMDQIWQWNHSLPQTYDCCMHDIVSGRAQESPDKVAILSWDGSLTYAEVDRCSSLLALLLRERGVEAHEFLPLCFEKSKWTVVAVLAVMKAGGTMVLMDPALPIARLRNMAEQVNAKTMVVSRNQYNLATDILPHGEFIILEAETFACFEDFVTFPALPVVHPSTLMYIIFTSGSTGTPKGVQVSHRSYSSSAFPRAKAVGYNNNSRVLDFASYAFDVSIDSMILTLANGGCLCIPSDEDRLNDINTAMRSMKVNYAGLTPSVARILDLDVIASLEGLGLGGEAASVSDVALWGQYARIIIGYGPCECTIGCTVNSNAAANRDYITIGPGNGAAIWIVDPDDHESLMPVGAVGELLVEGPIVGQGYLNDPKKTAAAFIQDPSWLVSGHGQHSGRQGRLYKTGDLGKYAPDSSGEIIFMGRKDTQVKLRGQRVELGEIESQLKARLPSEISVISEVITPAGSAAQPTLVVFIAQHVGKASDNRQLELACLSGDLCETMLKANTDVAKVLPRYMIPTAYIPINFIPTLISGKIDRKRLREFGSTVDLKQLDKNAKSTATRALSDLEQRLRQAWAFILKLNPDEITQEDNFFALGGNSLAAMRLVSTCRDRGLDLSVTGTFANPTLSEMANAVFICDYDANITVPEFSMISQLADSARLEASRICGTNEAAIEDIYPCTPTQESLFTFSLKSTKPYIAQRVACIPPNVNLEQWKKAWESVVDVSPILRTRLAQLQDPGLQQVVLKEKISWEHSTDLDQYLEDDRAIGMDLGQSLARYAIVNNNGDGKQYMVWTVHHVLYDGWSEPIILGKVRESLQHGSALPHQPALITMRDFVKYVRDTDQIAMQEFWSRELDGAIGPQFPRLPSRDFLPNPDTIFEYQITIKSTIGFPFTLATVIRGAWALVASQFTHSDDVVFGETLTGRDIPLLGVEGVIGPLIATVPIRIRIDRTKSVNDYLKAVQQAILSRTPYQHMGMQNIRKVHPDAQHACEAGTGLVIQPELEYDGTDLGFAHGDVVREALYFNPYPVMLACGMNPDGFRICASFDSSLIDISQMKRMMAQLETACSHLMSDLGKRVDQISCLPEAELNNIWGFNQLPPVSLDQASGKIRAGAETQPGSTYPPFLVPWVCIPQNPSLLSPIGCPGELWLEGPHLFTTEAIESPAWLLAGSSQFSGRSGQVRATGDIVQLQDNGKLVFVGRTENIVPVNGHSVDMTDFEAHFAQLLSPSVIAAAALYHPSPIEKKQPLDEGLIVFIEQQPLDKDNVELLPKGCKVSCAVPGSQPFETAICATISANFAGVLKRFDKHIRNSLPSHMVPYAYVVVEKMPITQGKVDHSLVNQLASNISENIASQLRESLTKEWSKIVSPANLTASQDILRSAWAEVLNVNLDQIDVDDNFFRLGGDSVSAMKLTSNLRKNGHRMSVADVFRHMRLRDAATVLKVNELFKEDTWSYRPFSMLGSIDIDLFLSECIRPKLANPNWSIKDVFNVTDSQALDVGATIQRPRTSIQYTMLYFDQGSIDQSKLLSACANLVKTHEVLRTVFVEHNSTLFQVVLDEINVPVTMKTTDADLDEFVTNLCTNDIESDFLLGSSFVRMFYIQTRDGKGCLVLGLSHAQYDGVSLPRLLRDLETLYAGEEVVNFEPFSSYVARIQNKGLQKRSLDYWSNLLSGSMLSILPDQSTTNTDRAVFLSRQTSVSKAPEGITTASVLTAAFALVIARRLHKSDVSFGGVTSGRNIDQMNTENVMGPCYQFAPIRVILKPGWSAMDLLRFVQNQTAESAAHDFVGFQKIAKQCAEWSSGANFFDSIVHHQDFEDFDHMPFANGSCRVDISNPHGDAAYPLKAVSFLRQGRLNAGLVGNQADIAFIDSLLTELVNTVEELVNPTLVGKAIDFGFSIEG
ncbi:acetyl-CoA synthetase-like protein [Trichoderma camerunense]